MSPDFLPPATCDFSHARKRKWPFSMNFLGKRPFSLSYVGKIASCRGVDNRGSLSSVSLALREEESTPCLDCDLICKRILQKSRDFSTLGDSDPCPSGGCMHNDAMMLALPRGNGGSSCHTGRKQKSRKNAASAICKGFNWRTLCLQESFAIRLSPLKQITSQDRKNGRFVFKYRFLTL